MAETLLLKTDKQPTFWNKEAAIGFFIGLGIPGIIIGGLMGKARMEKEKEVGKPVSSDPSFWNKDAALGGLIGLTLASITMALLPPLTVMLPAASPVALLAIAVAVPVLSGITGMYFGGESGQEKERNEFAKARAQQHSQLVSRERTREPELEPELAPQKSFTKTLEQERQNAPAHER